MGDFYLKARERFLKIPWDRIEDIDKRTIYKHYMDGKLVQEYFRRMAIFLNYVLSDLNTQHATLINAARIVGYDFESLWDEFEAKVGINNYHIKAICKFYLEWAKVADTGNEIALKFDDLYEPMIKLLEIGGGHILMHHGSLIGGDGFGMHEFYRGLSEITAIDISDQGLFDDQCAAIKNAEEVLEEYLATGRITRNCLTCKGKMLIEPNYSWINKGKLHTCSSHYVVRCEILGCFKIHIRKKDADYRITSQHLYCDNKKNI